MWKYFFKLVNQFYFNCFFLIIKGAVTKLITQLKLFLNQSLGCKTIPFLLFKKNKPFNLVKVKLKGRIKRKIRKKLIIKCLLLI